MKLLTGTLVSLLICFQFFDKSQAFVSQCLVCDSNQTECAEGSLQYIQSCPTGSEACFTSVTHGVLLRGCLSHLATTEVAQNCTEEEGHGCISCSENGCNTAPWLRCAHCDNDVGPDKCIDRQFVTFCPQYRSSDRCFEIVEGVEFKSISKGCESTLELAGNTCDQIERCRVVEKNSSNCTLETSLKTPVHCLVCSSENDSNEECVNGTLPGQNCPQEEDVCFSRVKGTTLERNCLSTLPPAERNVCTGEDSSCITCSDSGCNTDRLLQCVQCKKSDNIECIDLIISSTLKPSFCPSFLPDARCFSRILEDDLERGCSSESAGICVGNNRCLSCAADGCNVESETYLNNVAKCFRCTSNNGDNVACDEVYLGSEECDQLEDSCFMRVQGDILERNCLSTLVEADQQKCRDGEDNSCYSCSGFGCNQHPRLKCYRCSSLLDPRCANPEENDLGYTFCDSFLPDDRCYARIVDQHVERGCEVDLNNHDEDVCAGDPLCFACHSSGCNNVDENTLKNMAKCISCSTERDGEECNKAAMEAEQCDHFEDVCFTRVLGNNLQRGCLLTLEENEQTKCRDGSNTECITCQSPSCNNQPWLKCLSCKKSNNPVCSDPVSQEHELASFCTKYVEKAACYARITEEDLERGCSMELSNPNEVCADTVACEICTTDNCNIETEESLLSFSKCVQCTSGDVNSDCNKQLPEATKCQEKNDKCITRVFDGVLTRDCLSLLEDAEKLKCNDPKDLSCIVCEEPGCNQNQWTKCHQCIQSNSAGCEDEQSESDAELCKLYNANEECYIKLDQNHQLTRGCLSDVGTKDELCVDVEFCITCQGDSCNKAPESSLVPLACQQCTSADDECLAGTIESRPCPLLDDRCYTTVNSDKLLERGCLSTLSEDMQEICKNESDPSCTVCAENGCNEDRWPRCYRCNSSAFDDSCDHKLRPDLLEFCPSYHENTLCYAAIEQGSVTRDCTHEQTNICEGNNRCVACKEEGCNDIPKQELNTIHTCYQCRSDVEDCDHLKDHVRECDERNDRCYTRVDDDLILHRGCLSDIDAVECDNSEHCLICTDKNCNNAPWAKCFQCSNSTNERCSSKQTFDDNLKYCQQYARHGECYTMLDPIDFRRGCTSDLDGVPCNIPEDCVQCKGDGCNRESLKSYFNPAHCLRCHSDMHIGCINGTAPALACANPDDVCFYRRASTKAIHRGCLSELTATDQRMCQSTTSSACHTCDENGCNTPKWRSCYKCSSHVDESCAEKQTKGTFLEFCLKIDDDCFENNNHGEIYRGCGRHYCGEKKTCVECSSDACNEQAESALRPSHCLVCESKDPFCANGTSMNQYCDYLNEPCFTLVRDDGILERGCFSKLHESYKNKCLDETDRSCVACNSNSCNRDPWRQCVQCRSLELDQYCSRETSLLKSHFCSRFQRNDLCYAKDVQGIVIRGCQSDYSTQEDPCEGLEKRNCYTCDSDHCNVKTLNGVDCLNSMEKWTFVVLALLQGFLSWY